jgi:hypothetical protein
VHTTGHRLTKPYRANFQQEIAATLDDPSEMDEQIRWLFEVIQRLGADANLVPQPAAGLLTCTLAANALGPMSISSPSPRQGPATPGLFDGKKE